MPVMFRVVAPLCLAVALAAVMVSGRGLNKYNKPLHFTCPKGQFLSYISSENSNVHEDRTWNLQCKPVPKVPTTNCVRNCHKIGYANSFGETFAFQCPGEGFITGMHSIHSNHYEDRRFQFECCDVRGMVAHSCYYSGWQNNLDGVLSYHVPKGKVLRGVVSFHNTCKLDRRFQFQVCSLGH